MFWAGNVETSMYEENTDCLYTDSRCFEAVLMFHTVFRAGNVVETSIYEENRRKHRQLCRFEAVF